MKHTLCVLAWIGVFTCASAQEFPGGLRDRNRRRVLVSQGPGRREDRASAGPGRRGAMVSARRAARPEEARGLALTATGLAGGRLANVTAQVRGQGEVWLCLISGNGWLYSPATKPLTDQWQELSLSKVLIATDKSLGIYFITREVQPGAVFEVDRVQVKLSPELPTSDAPVGPWRLEAEDFAPSARTIAADTQALGGKTIRSEQYVIATDMPVPQTSRPLSIACRVHSGAADDTWRLVTWQGGNIQYPAGRQAHADERLGMAAVQAGAGGRVGGPLRRLFDTRRGCEGLGRPRQRGHQHAAAT